MFTTEHLVALIRVALRRVLPLTARMAGMVVVLMALLVLVGKGGAENMSAVLVGSTLGYILLVPMALSRDKIDGALEFNLVVPWDRFYCTRRRIQLKGM